MNIHGFPGTFRIQEHTCTMKNKKANHLKIFSGIMNKILIKIAFITFSTILFLSCADERIAGLNEKIRHDDFLYSITDITKGSLIKDGSGIFKAKGNFYIVKLKIINEAKRVEHKWDNKAVYVVDAAGKEYENDTEAQKIYYKSNMMEYKDQYNISASSTGETTYIFDLPKDVKEPYLKFRGNFLMGDFFDGGKFTKTKVKMF